MSGKMSQHQVQHKTIKVFHSNETNQGAKCLFLPNISTSSWHSVNILNHLRLLTATSSSRPDTVSTVDPRGKDSQFWMEPRYEASRK